MIVLGIVLLLIGHFAKIHLVWVLGIIVLVVGVVLMVMGRTGHGIRGRRHFF